MLSKKYRLTKTKDFENVFRQGKFFAEEFISLKTVKNNLDIPRFGFIVGKKASKKAARRNRVKRQMREIIRLRLNKIKIGFDIIIMVKPEIIGKDYKEIEWAMERVLEKASFLE